MRLCVNFLNNMNLMGCLSGVLGGLFLLLGPAVSFAGEECVVFPVGDEQVIATSGSYTSQLSPDGKKVVTVHRNGTAIIRDLESGKETKIQHQAGVNSTQFSPNGKKIVTASYDETAVIRDLENGKETKIQHQAGVNSAQFSPDGKKVVTASSDGTGVIRDLESGKETKIQHQDRVNSAQFSPDGKKVVTTSYDGTAIVRDLESGKETKIQHRNGVISARFSPDGKKVVTASLDQTAIIRDLESGKETKIQHQGWVYSAQFSPDGKKVVTASSDETAIVRDLESGKETKIQHQDQVNSAQFSPDGKKVVTASSDRTAITHDLESGKETKIQHSGWVSSAQFSPDGKKLFIQTVRGFSILSQDTVCVSDPLKIKADTCVQCSQQKPSVLDSSVSSHLSLWMEKERCQGPWDEKKWAGDTSLPASNPLPPKEALSFLKRFQKPEGFDPAKHLPILLAIFRSGLVREEPSLIQGTLQSVLSRSTLLYDRLLKDFPEVNQLTSSSPNSLACRTLEEEKRVLGATKRYLLTLLVKNGEKTKFENWDSLKPLAPVLSKLPQEQKAAFIEQIGQSLANDAADSPEFHNIFVSKILKFTKHAIAPYFGEAKKPISDLTYMRTKNLVEPLILGDLPIEVVGSNPKGTKSAYGFYSQLLDPIKIPDTIQPGMVISESKLQWKQGKDQYSVPLKISMREAGKTIIPEGDSPDYEGLWKDGKLTGLVIAGSNLGKDGATVITEYLRYYLRQGFEFDEEKKSISNLKQFLGDQVSSGKLDYLFKEAHSDGDEKNLFRVDTEGLLMRGTKTHPDGKKEEVFLVVPKSEGVQKTELIPNQEFGEWVRGREKNNQGQLVYFNTSCWSKTKALHEIEAASTSKLLNIPTLTITRTFGNYEGNPEREMLHAFRERKNYSEIRQALSEDEFNGYAKGTKNVFIFPDEERYKDEITRVVATPLDIQLQIQKNGKPYSIEQAE